MTAQDKNLPIVLRYKNGTPAEKKQALYDLIEQNKGIIYRFVNKVSASGFTKEDLFQEGVCGLIEAANRFDPSRGFRFISYATWWIKQGINFAIVQKIPSSTTRKALWGLNKAREKLEKTGVQPTNLLLANTIGVAEDVVEAAIALRQPTLSLDNCKNKYIVEQTEEDIDKKKMKKLLYQAVAKLPTREKEIIMRRWLTEDEVNLSIIAKSKNFKLSRERVRQIENQAFQNLRNEIKMVLDNERH